MPLSQFSFRQRVTWRARVLAALIRQPHAEILQLLDQCVPKNGVIIDVGAQTGQLTRLFAQAVPQGHVYAFEPASYARSIISKVIAVKKLGNVSLFPLGLGDQPSGEALHTSAGKMSNCPVMSDGSGTTTEKINLTTLDQFAFRHDLKRVDLIKADIKGAEMRFLLGAHHVVEKFRPTLLLGVNDARLHRAGASAEEVWRFLKALHYRIDRVENDGKTLTPLSAPIATGDIWCVPDERRKAA